MIIFSVTARSQDLPSGAEGGHFTKTQIEVLRKATANQPKGRIAIDSLGFMPPAPNAGPEFGEVKEFTTQLWTTLKGCGYEPFFPAGSHGFGKRGIIIYIQRPEASDLAESLRKLLLASGITEVRVEKDFTLGNPPNSPTLLRIWISSK